MKCQQKVLQWECCQDIQLNLTPSKKQLLENTPKKLKENKQNVINNNFITLFLV